MKVGAVVWHSSLLPSEPPVCCIVDAYVRVTLEIEAEVPDGVPEDVVRTTSENCRTLRFSSHDFEER